MLAKYALTVSERDVRTGRAKQSLRRYARRGSRREAHTDVRKREVH